MHDEMLHCIWAIAAVFVLMIYTIGNVACHRIAQEAFSECTRTRLPIECGAGTKMIGL